MREMLPPAAVEGRARMRLAAGREHRAAHEVRLAAHAAVEGMIQGLGRGLAGQIQLKSAVYGDHVPLPGYDQWVVGVVYAPELHGRVAV